MRVSLFEGMGMERAFVYLFALPLRDGVESLRHQRNARGASFSLVD
jgi:hypothetical protein